MRFSLVRIFFSRLGFPRMFYFDVIGRLDFLRLFQFFSVRFVIGQQLVVRILRLIRLVLKGC